jgi:DNA-binding MarR family transcriptional regulator
MAATKDRSSDTIIASVERLAGLFRLLLWDAGKQEKLSPIQIQFLIFLEGRAQELRTVSQLAREFNLTKATVSDAIKTLVAKGLVEKRTSAQDGRIATLQLTGGGRRAAARLRGWSDPVKARLRACPAGVKEDAALFLMDLIRSLQESGVIKVARMCLGCANFRRNAAPGSDRPHRCALTGRSVGNADLKTDCRSYEEPGPAPSSPARPVRSAARSRRSTPR